MASAGPKDKAPSWKPVGEVFQVPPSLAGDKESPRANDANYAHDTAGTCASTGRLPPPTPFTIIFGPTGSL